ncbi:MAG: HAD family hydrolase [Anaerolineales bacterium]|nr:HAD family hydrolase [Anaerolineales bacterium]
MTLPIHITTLLFDLDGTLIHQHPSSLDVLFTILDEHLVPVMATALRDTQQFMFRYWTNSEEMEQDKKMYGELTDEFWLHYLKRKLWAAGLTELQTTDLAPVIQKELIERYKPEVYISDDVRPTLKSLRRLGYKMGLVSNRPNPIEAEVKDLGFKSYFDFCFTSGEVKMAKPDPKIFEHALYLADSSPEITAYIGDNYYTDIVGAQNAGLYPVLIDPRNIFPDVECHRINKISDLVSGI